VNPTGNITLLTDSGFDTPQVTWNTSVDGSEGLGMFFKNSPTGGFTSFGRELALKQFSTGTYIGGGALACRGINFEINPGNNGLSGVIGDNGAGGIYLTGVSSINGAAPGGGGSAGPNLNVSTLSFPLGNETTAGVINMISSLCFNDSNTNVDQDIIFRTNIPIAIAFPPISSFVSTVNTVQVNGPGGDNANGLLLLAGSADGRALLGTFNSLGTPSTLAIVADNVIMPTNLAVSSINGAAPGGGVNPAGISTNQVVSYDKTVLLLGTNDVGTNITLDGGKGTAQISANNGAGDLTIMAANTNVTFNLNVSSINSAAYPPVAGAYPVVSTIQPGGGGVQTQYFTSTGQPVQVLTSFSTLVGHNYTLSIPFNVSTFNSPSYGEAIQFSATGVGASDLQYTLPLIQAGAWNFPISFKNKVGDGGVAVTLEANTAYPVEVNLGDSDGAELVDMGPSV
jgi:hypothetical protein